jgi:hypothetical protein
MGRWYSALMAIFGALMFWGGIFGTVFLGLTFLVGIAFFPDPFVLGGTAVLAFLSLILAVVGGILFSAA